MHIKRGIGVQVDPGCEIPPKLLENPGLNRKKPVILEFHTVLVEPKIQILI